jgi:hypothetical protein
MSVLQFHERLVNHLWHQVHFQGPCPSPFAHNMTNLERTGGLRIPVLLHLPKQGVQTLWG